MSEIDPRGILAVDVSKDPEFIQYRKKTRAKGIILSVITVIGFLFLIISTPFYSSVKKEIAPFGLDNYFPAENNRGLVKWHAGAAEYEEYIPYVSESQAEKLGKDILVYADENTIIDTISEGETLRMSLVLIAECASLGIAGIVTVSLITQYTRKNIERKASVRLSELAGEVLKQYRESRAKEETESKKE